MSSNHDRGERNMQVGSDGLKGAGVMGSVEGGLGGKILGLWVADGTGQLPKEVLWLDPKLSPTPMATKSPSFFTV